MKSQFSKVDNQVIDAGIGELVTQVARLDGEIVCVMINRLRNIYCIVKELTEDELLRIELGGLSSTFVEPCETEEEAKNRRALEHLEAAAKELGYKLEKT